MAAFNKKSKEYKEIISNSKSPSKNITKSFGVKKKSSRISGSRKERIGSPNQYSSNYSKSSWKKSKPRANIKIGAKGKNKEDKKIKKQFQKIEVRPKYVYSGWE